MAGIQQSNNWEQNPRERKGTQRNAKIRKVSRSFAKGPESPSLFLTICCVFRLFSFARIRCDSPHSRSPSCLPCPDGRIGFVSQFLVSPGSRLPAPGSAVAWSLVPGPWSLFPGLTPIHLSKNPARTSSAPFTLSARVHICARKRFRMARAKSVNPGRGGSRETRRKPIPPAGTFTFARANAFPCDPPVSLRAVPGRGRIPAVSWQSQ